MAACAGWALVRGLRVADGRFAAAQGVPAASGPRVRHEFYKSGPPPAFRSPPPSSLSIPALGRRGTGPSTLSPRLRLTGFLRPSLSGTASTRCTPTSPCGFCIHTRSSIANALRRRLDARASHINRPRSLLPAAGCSSPFPSAHPSPVVQNSPLALPQPCFSDGHLFLLVR